MNTPQLVTDRDPDVEKADVLARRLVEAYGLTVSTEIHAVITQVYRDVLSGASCSTVKLSPEKLLASSNILFGECVCSESTEERPSQPFAVQPCDSGSRIYLRVMDDAEERVAWHLRQMNAPRANPWKIDPKAAHIAALNLAEEKIPALVKLGARRLVIATGGPGTGKTHLIKGLLTTAIIDGGIDITAIRLAAPTNRAADRMRQSLAATAGLEGVHPAQTLHSLLGDRESLAAARLVIVDESSMADLTLIGRLLRRMEHPEASLVLAGDPDQLPSVEVGSVLADLVSAESFAKDCWIKLGKTHRFEDESEIASLAKAVMNGDEAYLSQPGRSEAYKMDALWDYLEGEGATRAFSEIKGLAEKGDTESMRQALSILGRQRVLCSHRVGKSGAVQLSKLILAKLKLENARSDGAIIMVLRNDHRLGIYNGDVGIVSDGNAHFANRGVLLRLGLSSLPEHELAFASTIHKAQGSEYERVAVVLGESHQANFMTRNMLYTGITRARKIVRLFETKGALKNCLSEKLKRASGLGERLEKV
jgi:exodeoxyribonuclease V alpha subunit